MKCVLFLLNTQKKAALSRNPPAVRPCWATLQCVSTRWLLSNLLVASQSCHLTAVCGHAVTGQRRTLSTLPARRPRSLAARVASLRQFSATATLCRLASAEYNPGSRRRQQARAALNSLKISVQESRTDTRDSWQREFQPSVSSLNYVNKYTFETALYCGFMLTFIFRCIGNQCFLVCKHQILQSVIAVSFFLFCLQLCNTVNFYLHQHDPNTTELHT